MPRRNVLPGQVSDVMRLSSLGVDQRSRRYCPHVQAIVVGLVISASGE
jgi:hypothetical protein